MRILASRRYKTGMGWAFWRWTDVLTYGEPYLTRLHLIKLPSGRAVMLHWIKRPDPQPDMHDHPVGFLALVLWGGYREMVPAGFKEFPRLAKARGVYWWNRKRATDVHRIIEVAPGTITLVFAGPKTREWGFLTWKGWVHWKEYHGERGPQ